MFTIETKILSYSELSEEAKEKAMEHLQDSVRNDPYLLENTSAELIQTMQAIAKMMGGKLSDYSFGEYCRGHKMRIELPYQYPDEGTRLLAVFTRGLIENGYDRPRHFHEQEFPGTCGLTGVYCDDDLLDVIHSSLVRGDSWDCACDSAAYRAGQILEEERDYLSNEQAILETLNEDEEQFLESGEFDQCYHRQA